MAEFERSAAEREAARLERARRRGEAAAAGDRDRAVPPIAEPYDDDAPIGIRRVTRARRSASRHAATGADEAGAGLGGPPPAGPGPAAAVPGPLRGRRGPRSDDERPQPEQPRERRPRERRPRERPSPERRPGRATGAPPSGRRRWLGRTIAFVPLLLAAVLIWFAVELYQPFHGSPRGPVTVRIPARAGATQIGDLLAARGVVPSGFFFNVRAMLAGDRGKLRSGTYRLRLNMSYGAVLRILTTPPPAAKVSELTLIEGLTRRQIDALLRSQHIAGSYLAATRHSHDLDPRRYGAPVRTPTLEGFLFPSTYQLRDPITVAELVATQLATFRHEFATVGLAFARSHHFTAYDILIVASMVQAEAQTARDRPLVASVIYNRLKLGMPLQIDATTRYATGNYTHPLTVSELNSRSPYNTRIHTGLPPTPIDNPGLAAIKAAADPARTHYLYFVAKPCGNGAHVFASSYGQFLHQAAAYQRARAARGGRSPERC